MKSSTEMVTDGYRATSNRGPHGPPKPEAAGLYISTETGEMEMGMVYKEYWTFDIDAVGSLTDTAGVGILTDA